MSLTLRHAAELLPTAPFHFDATVHHPDHFPTPDGAWQPGVHRRTMRFEDAQLGIRLEDAGSVERPCVGLSIWDSRRRAGSFYDRVARELEYRYNLRLDLEPFYRRFAGDPQLGPAIDRWRGMRPAHGGSLYEYLVIAIVLQNATVRRTVQMMDALFETYGTPLEFDGHRLWGFWSPARLAAAAETELRELKVGYRARSLLRVSEAVATGAVDELALRGRPVEEQRAALLGLHGIGPASVGYLLADVFHRLDEPLQIPPWEQKIYSRLFLGRDPEDPAPVEELRELLDRRFAGWRKLAVHYLWEDLFWQRARGEAEWLAPLIRL